MGDKTYIATSSGFTRAIEIGCTDNGNIEEWISVENNNNASRQITFGTGTLERVRITSDGSVGVGTTSPTCLLDVRGRASTVHTKEVSFTGVDTTAGAFFWIAQFNDDPTLYTNTLVDIDYSVDHRRYTAIHSRNSLASGKVRFSSLRTYSTTANVGNTHVYTLYDQKEQVWAGQGRLPKWYYIVFNGKGYLGLALSIADNNIVYYHVNAKLNFITRDAAYDVVIWNGTVAKMDLPATTEGLTSIAEIYPTIGDDDANWDATMIAASAATVFEEAVEGTIFKNGNVGIGSGSPAWKLDVDGDVNFTGQLLQDGQAYIGSQWTTTGTDIYYNNGNVGIGTINPVTLMNIFASTNGRAALQLANSNVGISSYAEIAVGNKNNAEDCLRMITHGENFPSSGAFVPNGSMLTTGLNISGGLALVARHTSGTMRFYTGGSAVANERMCIAAGGNVGIGTATPLSRLHVNDDRTLAGANTQWASYRRQQFGSSSFMMAPKSSGTLNGVNITALNDRTHPSYGSANRAVTTWTARTSANNSNWISVCWAPELLLFCAVAFSGSGSGNRVMTSGDGINWTVRTSAADTNWTSVCWSPERSIFCAVSETGATQRVMTSPDGITWTLRTTPVTQGWFSVCWAAELGLFCAVARTSSSGGRAMTSPDGITWTERTVGTIAFRSVCWAPELGIFCAVGENPTNASIAATSPDGITWTTRTAFASTWYSVTWSPELSLFVAVGDGAGTTSGAYVMTSPDGINWTTRTSSANSTWISVTWAPELSLFCASASSGTSRIMTSLDGINWISRMITVINQWRSICWAPELSMFCVVSDSGVTDSVLTSGIGMPNSLSTMLVNPAHVTVNQQTGVVGIGTTSPLASRLHVNGTLRSKNVLSPNLRASLSTAVDVVSTWSTRSSAADNSWRSVAWAPELGMFAAVSLDGTNRVMTSTNGINWTIGASIPSATWTSVTWSPELGLFVAVASTPVTSTTNSVMTSPNGITWTARSVPSAANSWNSVTWAPELGIFVAVASSGTGNTRVMTSTDGTTWLNRTSAADNSWNSVVWAPELRLFVAVSSDGTIRAMMSTDGINWTTGGSKAAAWTSVTWSPELGIFVAVAPANVMTSPDGTNWTIYSVPSANNWNSVTWAPELGIFVAVASTGTGNTRVMTSPDGITWLNRTSPADNEWRSVIWVAELGMFAAVASNGTGNRVMTSRIGWAAAKSALLVNPAHMTVNQAGNVGIGISPAWKLDVAGDINLSSGSKFRINGLELSTGTTDASALTAGTLVVARGGTGAGTLTGYVYGNGTGAMTASTSIPNSVTTATSGNTANAIVARDASGNFSAGAITATVIRATGISAFTTNATNTGALKICCSPATGGDTFWIGFSHFSSSDFADSNDRARIGVNISGTGAGNLIFTTGSPGAQAERMRLDSGGNLSVTADITAFSSDTRLKTRTSAITNPLQRISKLEGFFYKHNDIAKAHGFDGTDIFVGISAQDALVALPEVVKPAPFDTDYSTNTSKSGENYLTVQYERITPLLIEGIKELDANIEKENTALKARVESLEASNAKLQEALFLLAKKIDDLAAKAT